MHIFTKPVKFWDLPTVVKIVGTAVVVLGFFVGAGFGVVG